MNDETLIDKELDELYRKAFDGQIRGVRVGAARRLTAYALKTVAAGGSLLIATGLVGPWNQYFGVAVLVSVLVDTISSNHKRLIATVEAGYAYRALSGRVKGEYNRAASALFSLVKEGDSNAIKKLDRLKNQAHIALNNGIEEIEQKWANDDIKALQNLSLDQERAALQTQ